MLQRRAGRVQVRRYLVLVVDDTSSFCKAVIMGLLVLCFYCWKYVTVLLLFAFQSGSYQSGPPASR